MDKRKLVIISGENLEKDHINVGGLARIDTFVLCDHTPENNMTATKAFLEEALGVAVVSASLGCDTAANQNLHANKGLPGYFCSVQNKHLERLKALFDCVEVQNLEQGKKELEKIILERNGIKQKKSGGQAL